MRNRVGSWQGNRGKGGRQSRWSRVNGKCGEWKGGEEEKRWGGGGGGEGGKRERESRLRGREGEQRAEEMLECYSNFVILIVLHRKVSLTIRDVTGYRWFHGPISGKDAEKMLSDRGKTGSFLVRESQSQPGNYVLSVKSDDNIKHIHIRFQVNE